MGMETGDVKERKVIEFLEAKVTIGDQHRNIKLKRVVDGDDLKFFGTADFDGDKVSVGFWPFVVAIEDGMDLVIEIDNHKIVNDDCIKLVLDEETKSLKGKYEIKVLTQEFVVEVEIFV